MTTRQSWTYRGVEVRPDGRMWDATHTGAPLRAQSKRAMQEQIDAHIEAERYRRIADEELECARLERDWPWGGGR